MAAPVGTITTKSTSSGVRYTVSGSNVTYSSYSRAMQAARNLRMEASNQRTASSEAIAEEVTGGSPTTTPDTSSTTVGEFSVTSDVGVAQAQLGRAMATPKTAGELSYGAVEGDLVAQRMQGPQRVLVNEEVRSFSAGLITDNSPMQEISNSTLEEQNMLLLKDGSRARRRGLNYEDGFVRRSGITGLNVQLTIIPHGYTGIPSLIAVRPTTSNLSTTGFRVDAWDIAADGTIGTFDRSNSTSGYLNYNAHRQMSTWGKDLYVPGCQFEGASSAYATVAYQQESSFMAASQRYLFVRDLWGTDDGLDITERPTTLDANHLYNLVNQGWSWADISAFNTLMSAYPSNGDLPYFGKTTSGYDADLLDAVPNTGARAPRGACILRARNLDRSVCVLVTDAFTAQGSLSTGDIDDGGEQALTDKFSTEFSGRIVWASQRDAHYTPDTTSVPDFENLILFSTSIESPASATTFGDPLASGDLANTALNCHALNDPTSEGFQQLATDGGFFALPNAGRIMGLHSIGSTLVIIASNGVWSIRSPEGVFNPVTANIEKISGVGCESEKSVVLAKEQIVFKGLDGIYVIRGTDNGVISDKVSAGRIEVWLSRHRDQFHDAMYDPVSQEIRWLVHKSVEPGETGWAETGSELKQQELIYHMDRGAFTVNRFPNVTLSVSAWPTAGSVTSGTFILGYVPLPTPVLADLPERNDGTTTDEDVTRHTIVDLYRSTTSFKYAVMDSTGVTFADYSTDTYTDFTDTIDEEVDAYMITSYDNDGDSQRNKQVGHITISFYRTEIGVEDPGGGYVAANQGSCLLDYYWDHAQRTPTENSARRKETYKLLKDYTVSGSTDPYDYGQAVIVTKNKIRGRGKSLQLEFHSSADKDLQILGWGISKKVNRRG